MSLLLVVLLVAGPLAVAAVGRVVPILHANHFDDLMRDTRSGRPPSVGGSVKVTGGHRHSKKQQI